MADRVLFVDLENVHKVELSRVQPEARVLIFYGAKQKTLPEELVVQAQPFGTRLKWIKMSGQGPNALDFHIAFYLGRELAAHPDAECTVLSGDTGFDPLMRHLASLGHRCSRLAALAEPPPQAPDVPKPVPKAVVPKPPVPKLEPVEQDSFARLLMLLRKDNALPVRYTGLSAKVRSWFPRMEMAERTALLRRLFAEGRVQESGNTLSYRLSEAPAPAAPPGPPAEAAAAAAALTAPGVSAGTGSR